MLNNDYHPTAMQVFEFEGVEILHEWRENGKPRALVGMADPAGNMAWVIVNDEGFQISSKADAEKILIGR